MNCDLKHRLATGSLGGDQIPEDLKQSYAQICKIKNTERNANVTYAWVKELIERIAKAEAALAQKTRECEEYKKSTLQLLATIKRKNRRIENDAAQVEQLGRQVTEARDAGMTTAKLLQEALDALQHCNEEKVELGRQVEAEKEKHEYFVSLYEPQHRQALEERDEARRQVAEMSRTNTSELELLACAMWAKEKCTTKFGIDIKAWINMHPEPKAQWIKLASRARTK